MVIHSIHSLRAAEDRDIPEICAIDYELFPDNNFNETTLRKEITEGLSYLLHVDGELAGYTLLRFELGGITDILRLGVRERFRRHGLGTVLLDNALRLGKTTMLTVRKGNDPAIRLYLKHGFKITGSMPQAYSWLMTRSS